MSLKLGTKVVDFAGEDPYVVAFSDGYEDYQKETRVLNPYPADTRANWGWDAGQELAQAHAKAEQPQPKGTLPQPIQLDLEDEEGVTYGALVVQPIDGRVMVSLSHDHELVDSWLAEPTEASGWAEALLHRVALGCPAFFDLTLEANQARDLADALSNTAACIKRGWV
jgi:hypothetical protein